MLALSALLLASLVETGCSGEETLTVYPDGSGKIERKLILTGPAALGPVANLKGRLFDKQGENFGHVFWTPSRVERSPGKQVLIMTGYFEDVTGVKPSFADAPPSFGRDGTGVYRLELPLAGAPDVAAEPVPPIARCLLASIHFTSTFVMPGTVLEAQGCAAEDGRRATFTIGGEELMAATQGRGRLPRRFVIISRPPDDRALAEELAAFRRELEAAKAAAGRKPRLF
jgi:hypothetical protein